jgi:hypothetical protein
MVNNTTNIVDIGGIVDHHCLEVAIRLLILVVLLRIATSKQ